MNWEESRALTALKRDFLKAFSERSDAFFLTGGSALGIFYLGHRLSFDLDFFTTGPGVDWHVLENDVRAVASLISATVRPITAAPSFHRFELSRGTDREILDFVLEMTPQVDVQKQRFGSIRVDTLREIMVNKICTLAGRCETKDLIDLYFLYKRGLTVKDHMDAARKKEGGLDPAMVSYILARAKIDNLPDYLLESVDLHDFAAFVRNLQKEFAAMAFPDVEDIRR